MSKILKHRYNVVISRLQRGIEVELTFSNLVHESVETFSSLKWKTDEKEELVIPKTLFKYKFSVLECKYPGGGRAIGFKVCVPQ